MLCFIQHVTFWRPQEMSCYTLLSRVLYKFIHHMSGMNNSDSYYEIMKNNNNK